MEFGIGIAIEIIVLVCSVILHEIMHGFVADRLGDPTARLSGRLTLNPIPHIDPMMSILIPAILLITQSPILFGAAKPVPVNPIHFKDPKKDMGLTALAGPMTNFGLAFLAAMIWHLLGNNMTPIIFLVLKNVIFINLSLTLINLIPIPPLDGSKVVSILLSEKAAFSYQRMSQYGFFLLFALLYLTPLSDILNNLFLYALRLFGL